mmetsp:Transcript_3734/g.7240  ORF Transcript_3734/g.7240 Transcript_3734/m.7240 type:complete len:232 (-) Transcript_3734:48-743(-)
MLDTHESEREMGRVAVVLGGTGATGSQVVAELVQRPAWSRVIAIGRRPVPEDEGGKITNVVVPNLSDADSTVDASAFEGADTLFNCIGTTRSSAGSADKFHQIEVDTSAKVAAAAKDAGVKQALVVSAQGASPDRSFAPKWFHPLFYGKTMGLKEKAVQENGFERTVIFRPGMLDREQTDRTMEKIIKSIIPSLKVSLLAKAMVNVAESTVTIDKPMITGNSAITSLANPQ